MRRSELEHRGRFGPTPRCPDEPWLRSDGARGELCLVLCLYWPLHENQRLASALDAKAALFRTRDGRGGRLVSQNR